MRGLERFTRLQNNLANQVSFASLANDGDGRRCAHEEFSALNQSGLTRTSQDVRRNGEDSCISAAPQIITFAVGGGTVALGQVVAHRFTLGRDRRNDFAKTIDSALHAFAAADHTVKQLAMRMATDFPPELVQRHADLVSEHEVTIDAALFSVATRLPPGHPFVVSFEVAQRALEGSWQATGPLHAAKTRGPVSPEWDAWSRSHDEFTARFHDLVSDAYVALRDKKLWR